MLSYEAERRLHEFSRASGRSTTPLDRPACSRSARDRRTPDRHAGAGAALPVCGPGRCRGPALALHDGSPPPCRSRGTRWSPRSARKFFASLRRCPRAPAKDASDEAWYWAAPVLFDQALLDLPADEVVELSYGEDWGEHDSESAFYEHLDRAAEVNARGPGTSS